MRSIDYFSYYGEKTIFCYFVRFVVLHYFMYFYFMVKYVKTMLTMMLKLSRRVTQNKKCNQII